MKNTLLHQAAKFKLQNRKHKRWQKAVSILACIVVFCTVYALILPALTAEGTPHCGIEEHTHTDECYENRLICGKEEGEGAHTHTDECYTQEQTLICGLEEGEGAHTHTEECYDEEGNLICGLEENEGHQHTEECYQTEDILTCDQEESEGHQHTAECYEQVLACGKEEHVHSLACYSDPNADVEDADTWQNSVSSVSLTGNWGSDLAAIAQTQIGYRESTSNYNVAEDGATMNGYTRYGAWAGDPYRDNWSAQFTDFCLSYAGIPSSAMVQPSDCWEWAPVYKEGYTPNTGDLIILDGNQDGTPDHAGIVLSANDTQVTTVIGDSDKEVKQNTYNLDNAIIVGYVTMPRNPNFDYGDAEPAADDADAPEPDNNIEETPTAEPEETPEVTPEAEEAIPEESQQTEKEEKKEEKKEVPAVAEVTDTSWCTAEKAEDSNIEDEESEQSDIEVFSGEECVSATATGNTIDFGQYITKAVVKKIVNGEWKEATEFNNGDQIKTDIEYDIPAGILSTDNRVISYQLPDGVLPQGDLNGVVYSKGSAVGTYTISSTGLIEITFNEDFVDSGSRIDGDVGFSGTVSSDNTKVDKDIIFGGKGGTITIKKEEETPETGDINITKEGTLSADKKTIEYKVTVSTVNGTKKTVTVKDYLKNATYKKDVVIKDKDGKAVTGDVVYYENQASAESSFEIKNLPELTAGEWYELTYSVAVGEGQADGTNIVENTASANDKSKWVQ